MARRRCNRILIPHRITGPLPRVLRTRPRSETAIFNPACQAGSMSRWVVKLDKHGCDVSTGPACASGQEEPLHVLRAMGFASAEAARALRFSAGWETAAADWSALLKGLETIQDQILHPVKN